MQCVLWWCGGVCGGVERHACLLLAAVVAAFVLVSAAVRALPAVLPALSPSAAATASNPHDSAPFSLHFFLAPHSHCLSMLAPSSHSASTPLLLYPSSFPLLYAHHHLSPSFFPLLSLLSPHTHAHHAVPFLFHHHSFSHPHAAPLPHLLALCPSLAQVSSLALAEVTLLALAMEPVAVACGGAVHCVHLFCW